MYNEGISIPGDLLETGVLHGVVTKSGNSYSMGDVKFGVGREKAKQELREHPELMKKIREEVWKAVRAEEAQTNAPKPQNVE